MPHQFYSHGKLMFTGEYLVLFGAKALAMPVNRGQYLFVEETQAKGVLKWQSYEFDNVWFNAEFEYPDFRIINSSNPEISVYIQNLLLVLRDLNPQMFDGKGLELKTKLTFSRNWGLGSSSTLINNLAQWAGVSPYKLNNEISKGSGYDIACAQTQHNFIIYRLQGKEPIVEQANCNKNLFDNIYFVYSGKKQSTEKAINRISDVHKPDTIKKVTELTEAFIKSESVEELCAVIKLHDELLSGILGMERLKKTLFSDFKGEIKPMGAWGGDFFMAVTLEKKSYVENYFTTKGFNSIYRMSDFLI